MNTKGAEGKTTYMALFIMITYNTVYTDGTLFYSQIIKRLNNTRLDK